MADKLLIVLHNTDPANVAEVGAPLLQASVAAAMEYEVEIVLTGRAGRLANQGYAAGLRLSAGKDKTVYDLMRDAVTAGVRLKVCASDDDTWSDDLIPEICETVGAAYIISEAMDDDTVTFTY